MGLGNIIKQFPSSEFTSKNNLATDAEVEKRAGNPTGIRRSDAIGSAVYTGGADGAHVSGAAGGVSHACCLLSSCRGIYLADSANPRFGAARERTFQFCCSGGDGGQATADI